MDSVTEQLRGVLVEMAGFNPDFAASADFYSDLAMPSMKAMQLLFDLEERFSISIPDDEFVEATTLESLSTMIHRHLEKNE